MLAEDSIQATIWRCLNHYDYADAIFLAEHLMTEVDTDETLFLLATCYFRAGKKGQAYSLLNTKKLMASKTKFLFAKCCIELGRISEAELILTGGEKYKRPSEEELFKEYGEHAAFVLQLLARIYYKSERQQDGSKALKTSLQLNPLLWHSFQDLCYYGEKVDPNVVFQTKAWEKYNNMELKSSEDPPLNNNVTGKPDNPIPQHSSTPTQSMCVTQGNSLSGISQFTPDTGNTAFVNPLPSVMETESTNKNSCCYSPFTASFGIVPLDKSHENFFPSPTSGLLPPPPPSGTLTETNEQKILSKRQQFVGCNDANPLISKPNINQSCRADRMIDKSRSQIPLQNVRRSSRIVSSLNYSVKENNKSITHRKFVTPKSPSYKLKSSKISRSVKNSCNEENSKSPHRKYIITKSPQHKMKSTSRILRNTKSNLTEVNFSDKFSLDNKDNTECVRNTSYQERLNLQKQSLDGLMSLMRYLAKGYQYLSVYNVEKALEFFNELPENHKNSPTVLMWIGKGYVEMHDYKTAVRYFKLVEEKEPYRVNGMEVYSTALWHLHKEVELSYLAHNLMKFDRLSPSAWCAAGNCLSLQKEHDVAIRFFQRAIQLNPNFVYAYTLLGHEYVVTEEFEKAMCCFRTAVRVQPRHYNAWYGMGSIYSKQEKYQMAELHFKRALALHPKSTVILCHIGVVQSSLQKPYSALDTFNKALSINPKSALCKFHRASLYFNMLNYEGALKELEELMEIAPKEPLVYYLMGKVHKKLQNNHLSLMCFSWAADLDPKGTNVHNKESNSDPLMNASLVSDIGEGIATSSELGERADINVNSNEQNGLAAQVPERELQDDL